MRTKVILLEALDLIVTPHQQSLIVDPQHLSYPVVICTAAIRDKGV